MLSFSNVIDNLYKGNSWIIPKNRLLLSLEWIATMHELYRINATAGFEVVDELRHPLEEGMEESYTMWHP
jgi:hypothetical protein